jgi:hypothetical protein
MNFNELLSRFIGKDPARAGAFEHFRRRKQRYIFRPGLQNARERMRRIKQIAEGKLDVPYEVRVQVCQAVTRAMAAQRQQGELVETPELKVREL